MHYKIKSAVSLLLFFGFVLVTSLTYAQSALSKSAAEAMAQSELKQQSALYKPKAELEWENKSIALGAHTLKFAYRKLGEKPKDGYSMYISMHGGGNTSPATNDQQWKNQINLYTPAEGIYVAPRAPTNTWNLWHEAHIDTLFDRLIKDAVIMEGVNPNKIYLLGYSAGGDGTFQLAPRMADYWAASAMMAGHPGDAAAMNLRNLPFAIYVGGVDKAYNRNKLAGEWGLKLDSLEKSDPGSFQHDVHVYPDLPHWMNRKDTVAIPWLASFKRNALPAKVTWHQDDMNRTRFYWLGVPAAEMKTGAEVIASISENTVLIEKNDNTTLLIYLNDQMLNLDKKVKVIYLGKTIFNGKVKRDQAIIKETAAERLDKDLIFYSRIAIKEGKVWQDIHPASTFITIP
ncbi:alpha/beta hydrolase family protein [Pedobacter metabolipauper]|uniref:Esterase/PHB depolymerase n=1 Tax=Pedobacter metabolipauper TaxID=425513 RepID=A0A4R6SY53_9SPHI|nr:alpha/beta hydrolase [Pedobacter metabolipauper]TDQ10915.1 hypothetical protein ATK78_0023 [Pedobacter metabolipauper]